MLAGCAAPAKEQTQQLTLLQLVNVLPDSGLDKSAVNQSCCRSTNDETAEQLHKAWA
jgi:hypothetical protein